MARRIDSLASTASLGQSDVIDCNSKSTPPLTDAPTARTRSSAPPQSEVRFNNLGELEGSLEVLGEAESLEFDGPPSSLPRAILRPTTTKDIQTMVRDCAIRGIPVTARGQGTSSGEYALCPAGLEIDMRRLRAMQLIDASTIRVGAGALWSEVLEKTLSHQRRPQILTNYLGLTVGGTLSLGGLGPNYMDGCQANSVRALTVITGTGERITCNREHRPELFHAALGGLGQFGIIADATICLQQADEFTTLYQLPYEDSADFFHAVKLLVEEEEADEIYGIGEWRSSGRWGYRLHVARHFRNGQEPTAAALLRGLPPPSERMVTETVPYQRHVMRLDRVPKPQSSPIYMRPRFSALLPAGRCESFCQETLQSLSPRDVGTEGMISISPQRSAAFNAGSVQIPAASKWSYQLDVLTSAPGGRSDERFEQELINRNRRLDERARHYGGIRYPVGALDFSDADWRRHFAHGFARLAALKNRMDPSHVLAGGVSIFTA